VRFKNKFEYSINVDPGIDKGVKVPKMILHIHTENAIKHGLINRETEGRLMISIVKDDDKLVITIEDNGIGRLKSAGISKYSTHRGYKILEELFSLHFRIYHQHIIQKITDLTDEQGLACGTAVTIVYPVMEEIDN
jgi:sensor histidine kinase YesM